MFKKEKTPDENAKEMPFLDHLEELRWRILRSLTSVGIFTLSAFPFTNYFLDALTHPNDCLKEPAKLVFLKPAGMVVVRMELALAVGILVSLPVLFYQFWQFVSPGLMPKERKYFLPILFYTTGCFLAGALFCYFVMIPIVLPFLYSMGTESIQATININEYISFILQLILVSGAIFELPILSFFLARVGILDPKFLTRYRRYGIVAIFIIAAVITPPDPASQLIMALPLLMLYEVSIWVARIGYRRKKERDDAWKKE
jgi:sec-independent protein translocase protein TatC